MNRTPATHLPAHSCRPYSLFKSQTNLKVARDLWANAVGEFVMCPTSDDGVTADDVYFGQNASFAYNVFLSPDKAQESVFEKIDEAKQSFFVNKQENALQMLLSDNEFEQLSSGSMIASIDIISNKNQAPFNKALLPRIVLFQTIDGRKGAIKIKEYVNEGLQSYILVDIKIQKIP